ncbi:MAG: HNH endonuclease [Planctomycetota bacterium]|jgi:5-methylcytosine-specific restriction endonuclease McrA
MLNAHYVALRVIGARRAFSLLFKQDLQDQPLAEVVSLEDGRYVSYDFDDWRELSEFRREFEPEKHDWVRTVRFHIAVPRIIRVLAFNKLPRQEVKLNRRNIYARDQSLCQYCGKRFKPSELSLDHVVPRSRGGTNAWDNMVCCCVRCNVRKGGRTPQEAGMRLIAPPVKPRVSPVVNMSLSKSKYSSWQQFLDHAYWNVELK